MLDHVPLNRFLRQLNVSADVNLPWMHSSAASNLFQILNSSKIIATPCNIFQGEKLCYLFVGRAAYKCKSAPNPSAWQLPVVFVVRFRQKPPIKRIFPFDSGAFKQRRLPDYITSFPIANFDLSGQPSDVGRLISFFFRTPERYLKRSPAGPDDLCEENNLDMRHAMIQALMRLYSEGSTTQFDDRAATVEIQLAEDIALAPDNLLGVIMPAEYGRTPGVLDIIKQLTPNVEQYDLLPLGTDSHYGAIYDAVRRIYKLAGVRP